MSTWQLLYNSNDIEGGWRNVVGSPVVSASKIASGLKGLANAPAGVYRFTVAEDGGDYTVNLSFISKLDYANGMESDNWPLDVIADGLTYNYMVMPGWGITFAADAQDGDVFEVAVGCYWDSTIGTWVRGLSFGSRATGIVSGEISLTAKNLSGGTLTDCMAVVTNAISVVNVPLSPDSGDGRGDRPFAAWWQAGRVNPDPDTGGSEGAVTIANRDGGGIFGDYLVALAVDGANVDIYDLTNDTIMPAGDAQDLDCDETTIYKFPDGSKYQGLHFFLGEGTDMGDEAEFYVSDGGAAIQIAQATGAFTSGVNGAILTESGQDTGTVTDDGEVTFRIRINPLMGTLPDLNQRSFSLRLIGTDVGGDEVCAEWQGSLSLFTPEGKLTLRTNPKGSATAMLAQIEANGIYLGG
jgi:hypothetical protein